jgi:hypothetical protein
MDPYDDAERATLADLAAEANRRRQRARDETGEDVKPEPAMPSWLWAIGKFGVGTVIALILVNWLQSSVDKKLDLTLTAAQETRRAQTQAGIVMGAFATESARQTEIMLLVQRQTCANTAKSDDARDRCYATKTK